MAQTSCFNKLPLVKQKKKKNLTNTSNFRRDKYVPGPEIKQTRQSTEIKGQAGLQLWTARPGVG